MHHPPIKKIALGAKIIQTWLAGEQLNEGSFRVRVDRSDQSTKTRKNAKMAPCKIYLGVLSGEAQKWFQFNTLNKPI